MPDHAAFDPPGETAGGYAGRLRHAAVLIRRHASRLTYHPVTGERPRPGPELLGALAEVDHVVRDVQRGAAGRAQEEVAVSGVPDAQAAQLRLAHGAVEQGAQAVLAGLDVLRRVLGTADGASVDAPYGSGAPRRQHPGALSTLVAERVEGLAEALDVAAIVGANRALNAGE